MNGGTSSLKVTVNGKKYLITGIQRETSCKGLLCAIAKVTSQEEEFIRSYSQRTSETENLLERFKGDRKLAGDLTSFNVFNSLAKDAKIISKETATHSLKTIRKEAVDVDGDDTAHQQQRVKQSSSNHHKTGKKQQKHQQESSKSKDSKSKDTKTKDSKTKDSKTKDSKTKEEKNKEKKSKHKQRNKNKETLTTTTTTTLLTTKKTETTKVKHKIKHRSVDDSDIESYKRDNLKRMRNKRRVYDDSDVEIYKTLQNIVLDQNKKLTRIQGHSRELKKAAWVKELKRNSQIYYLDDNPTSEMVADPVLINELLSTSDGPATGPHSSSQCSFDKDDGNDSGLPSPEYDSSESQENQPISKKLKETVPLLNNDNNNNNTKYETSTNNKEKVEPANHISVSNENNRKTEQLNGDILQNSHHSVKASNNGESSNSISESISVISANGLTNETFNNIDDVNTNVRKEDSEEDNNVLQQELGLNETEVLSTEKEEKHMLTTSKTLKKDESPSKLFNHSLLLSEEDSKETMMIDKNKNILKDSEICEREVSKMVAFNEALFKGSNNNTPSKGIGKKLEKKKFKKCDISDPVLLSPSTLKKHHNVKKVQSVLGKKAADLLRQDVVKSAIKGLPPNTTANKEKEVVTKEKEKYFNKKLKEIRSRASKKNKSNNKDKSEPEYFSKKQLDDGSSSIIATTANNSGDIKTKLENNDDTLTAGASTISEVKTEKTNNTDLRPESTTKEVFESVEDTTSSGSEPTEEMFDKTTCISGELSAKDVSKADEILNEILEYEKNIKNELDQILQCNHDQEDNKKEETNIEKEEDQSSSTNKTSLILQQTKTHESNNNTTSQPINLVNMRTDSKVDEEQQHFELVENYLEEKQALEEISQKLNKYNYALSRLEEEIQLINLDECEPKSSGELDDEELHIIHEIENVRSLLLSVVELTSYQRKEMSENMELLDNIDLEYRTQKANYENLRTGTWRTNSKSAPRSLIKNVKVKRKNSLLMGSTTGNANAQSRNSSSFV